MAVATIEKDLVPVTNRYDLIDSQMNSFMHGYVLDMPNSYVKTVCLSSISDKENQSQPLLCFSLFIAWFFSVLVIACNIIISNLDYALSSLLLNHIF